jgi:purine-binding chemotaxis protein CheW
MVASGERSASSKVLVMRVGAQLCAVPASSVLETCRPLTCETVPNAPSFVVGVALLRARPTPVVDVSLLLGAGTERPPARYVTLKVDPVSDRVVALAVDAVLGMRELSPEQLEELPPLLRHEQATVSALATLDRELLLLLQHGRLLPDALWAELDAARFAS